MVDSTHNDDDTNSHMSDIPLQLPARANVSSNISALVPFSQAVADTVLIPSQSSSDTVSDRSESLAITVSCYKSSKCTCSSRTSRSCSTGHTMSTRSSVRSARNGSTCSTPTTRQNLMLYDSGSGQTWNATNPGHHKASESFVNYESHPRS